MAEAVAGETGKPYVFVDPGGLTAFGFGALAVKGVFRKLRKLAVRYGGVVVFFDEADALGSRGALAQGGWNQGYKMPLTDRHACNGLSYVSDAAAFVSLQGERQVDGVVMGNMMGGGG